MPKMNLHFKWRERTRLSYSMKSSYGSYVHNWDVLLKYEQVILCFLLILFKVLYSLYLLFFFIPEYFWYFETSVYLLFLWPIIYIFTTSPCPVHYTGHTISLFLSAIYIPIPKSMKSFWESKAKWKTWRKIHIATDSLATFFPWL